MVTGTWPTCATCGAVLDAWFEDFRRTWHLNSSQMSEIVYGNQTIDRKIICTLLYHYYILLSSSLYHYSSVRFDMSIYMRRVAIQLQPIAQPKWSPSSAFFRRAMPQQRQKLPLSAKGVSPAGSLAAWR